MSQGFVPFVMTTGSRGLHVVVPLSGQNDFDTVREFARKIGNQVASQNAEAFTMEHRKVYPYATNRERIKAKVEHFSEKYGTSMEWKQEGVSTRRFPSRGCLRCSASGMHHLVGWDKGPVPHVPGYLSQGGGGFASNSKSLTG